MHGPARAASRLASLCRPCSPMIVVLGCVVTLLCPSAVGGTNSRGLTKFIAYMAPLAPIARAPRILHAERILSLSPAVVPPANVRGTPEWAPGIHDERGLQRDGDSEQDQKHQARHRRNVRLVPPPLPPRWCAIWIC